MKTYENFIKNLFNKKPKIYKGNYKNGQKDYEKWVLNKKYHREDGPARQEWYENGQKEDEIWYLDGKKHREDGPADQKWYKDGQKFSEEWILNSKTHREDGPAFQNWSVNGDLYIKIYYLNGKQYSRENWVEELGKIGSKHYDEQQMLLNMEKYNI